jgi:predicted AAA+ superfamily ATPase
LCVVSEYVPRIADAELRTHMGAMGAVLIEGPKACGKTATASRMARTVVRFDEDDVARSLLALDPDALFEGPVPILFDEWQLEPAIWNRVRRRVDDSGRPGEFLLTGSATPRDDAARHSGAGRFAVMRMRPMSLSESGHSSGSVSLGALLAGERQVGAGAGLTYRDLLQRMVVGGWPSLLGRDETAARSWLRSYVQQMVEIDVPSLGHRRSPRRLLRLLAALARNVGQAVKLTELAADVGGDGGPIANETLYGYLDALERLRLVDDSEAWRPHMRSRTRLRSAPVRYFVDPSLGTTALDVGSAELRADPRAAGFYFESLVVRDLRIYAQLLDGVVSSWRDANGHEIDAIIELRDGSWGAFEIKLNPRDVDGGATSLLRFAAKVDVARHGDPSALVVVTGTGRAGRRDDGVHVVPIDALGP